MIFDDAIAAFLQKGAFMVQAQAVEHDAPYKEERLRGDITVFPRTKAHEVEIGNTKLIDYAKYVYYGTKPHTIKPKKKKGKRITDKNGRKMTVYPALNTPFGYFKSVKHPGTKANPYLDIALENVVRSGRFGRILDDMGDDMSEEMFENITKSLKNMIVK